MTGFSGSVPRAGFAEGFLDTPCSRYKRALGMTVPRKAPHRDFVTIVIQSAQREESLREAPHLPASPGDSSTSHGRAAGEKRQRALGMTGFLGSALRTRSTLSGFAGDSAVGGRVGSTSSEASHRQA